MKILDMHSANALEATSTIEVDSTQTWVNTTVYSLNELVRYGDTIYKSAQANNINNTPTSAITAWLAIDTVNEKSIYDVYPDTLSVNTTADIILTYNVTNIDTIFVGNAKGNTLSISIGGNTLSKVLIDSSVSPNQAWGLTDNFHGTGDLFMSLPALTSGTLTVTLTRNNGEASMGYVLFGEAVSVGCTLQNEAVKYNVVSGITSKGKVTGIERARTDSYIEMILPIYVNPAIVFSDILRTLAEYRGVPVLVIGDDTGDREEMIFWGIYTEIDASITERNSYNITLTSLDASTYVPATELEISEEQQTQDAFNPTDFIFWGFDSGSSSEIVFDNSDITSYYNGLALATEVGNDMNANATINVNNLGSQPIYKDGVLLQAGQLQQQKTYIMYYRNNRFNVASNVYYNYGDSPTTNGVTLTYIDENFNTVTKTLSDIIKNTANDATITGGDTLTYTDDTDGVISVLVEDLLNQPSYNEIDKTSRHYINGSLASVLPTATTTSKGVAELATNAETQAGTDTTRIVTPASLASLTATTSRRGLIEIATNAEVLAGTSTSLSVTPSTLLNYFNNHKATTTQIGTTEIATQAEVDARTDTFRYLTPATFNNSEAKTTQKGIIELATCAEVEAGTDTTRAVVPKCLFDHVKNILHVNAVTGVPVASDFSNRNDCIVYDCSTGKGYFLSGGAVTELPSAGSLTGFRFKGGFYFDLTVPTITTGSTNNIITILGGFTMGYSLPGSISTLGHSSYLRINGVTIEAGGASSTVTGSVAVNDGDIVEVNSSGLIGSPSFTS